MGRRKKPGFLEQKMLASRVEKQDYLKFEQMAKDTGRSLQELMNIFIVQCISGSLSFENNQFVVKENKNE